MKADYTTEHDSEKASLGQQQNEGEPQGSHLTVHIARHTNPEKPIVSEDVKLRNARSKQVYPGLNLSDHEYVIASVKRHPIGLFVPMLIGGLLNIISLIALFFYDVIIESINSSNNTSIGPLGFIVPVVTFIVLISLLMYIVYYVYYRNSFLLTNESVIQEIQFTLFSTQTQTVSLNNVEETSYTQKGIIQNIFNYGSIRLSTIGDEHTYRFTYVDNPKKYIDLLNNAVEAFKNGRPVENA